MAKKRICVSELEKEDMFYLRKTDSSPFYIFLDEVQTVYEGETNTYNCFDLLEKDFDYLFDAEGVYIDVAEVDE